MSDIVEQDVEAVDIPEVVDSEEIVVDETDAGVAEEESPFFEYDGRAFKKPGELADFIKHRGMRKDEYETERQRVQERVKRIEEMERNYKSKETLAEQLAAKYEPIDALMKGNPDFERAVHQLYERASKGGGQASGSDPRELMRKIVKEELQPYEQWRAETEKERETRKAQEVREKAAARMREQDKDFDESLLENYLKQFEEFPPEEQQYAAMKVAWDAVRGSTSAAELERRAAESRAKKGKPSVTSTPGQKNAEIDVTKMSEQELREAALKDLGIA